MQNVHLLVIDPQVDFCDPNGALFVQGAAEDISRLTALVRRVKDKISDIHVTLDSHHLIDIAHPIFWVDADGVNPNPFTIITVQEVKDGNWRTKMPGHQSKAESYVEQLEKNGRYPLCIWPPHCLIGSDGHAVKPDLFDALKEWESERFSIVDYVTKGSNPWTEHYSAVQADVPDPKDPSTQINSRLIDTLMEADLILVAGEAGSHCLANTVRDIANNFKDEAYVQKLILLEDATSPVPGFETFQEDFIKEMSGRGMQITKTTEWMKEGSTVLA